MTDDSLICVKLVCTNNSIVNKHKIFHGFKILGWSILNTVTKNKIVVLFDGLLHNTLNLNKVNYGFGLNYKLYNM